jgi:hypothetical protein
MMSGQNNVERLHAAGILVAENFSESDKKVIESITPEEIEVLIKLRKKVGAVPAGKEHMRPNMFV